MQQFSIAALVRDIKAALNSTKNAYGFPHLFEQMVKSCNQYPDNGKHFPIALLDFYTGFKLENKAILNLCLRTRSVADWSVDVDSYWSDTYRGRIKSMFEVQHGKKYGIELLNDIATFYILRP